MSAMNLDAESFRRLVLEEGRTAVVDFWAPWCSYCRRLEQAYAKVAQDRPELTGAKVNIDDLPEIAGDYGIEVIPTLVLFRGGRAVSSITAPESKARIEAFIDESL